MRKRGGAFLILAAFALATQFLPVHILLDHPVEVAECDGSIAHFCPDPSRHEETPCAVCGLGAGALAIDRPERLAPEGAVDEATLAPQSAPFSASPSPSACPRAPPVG